MTDTERINWLEANKCALGQHATGQWRVVQNATGGPGSATFANRVSVGDTLREAIDNGINANTIEVSPP